MNNTEFYYSDGRGNSIYSGSRPAIPYVYNNYPSAVWVDAANNRIPANLVIYQYINGYPSYFCRVAINGQWFYGQLVINHGCVMQGDEEQVFDSFQVLVK